MESNKIIIGVELVQQDLVFELITLRDILLKDLLAGIKYGLKKRANSGDKLASGCYEEVDFCLTKTFEDGFLKGVSLSNYNPQAYKNGKFGAPRYLGAADYAKPLDELGFISSTRIIFDRTAQTATYPLPLKEVTPAFLEEYTGRQQYAFPNYNISTREYVKYDETPVEIIPPTDPPQKPGRGLLATLLPPVVMAGAMTAASSMTGVGGSQMKYMRLFMTGATAIVSVGNWISERVRFKKSLKLWRKQYSDYIVRTIAQIEERKEKDCASMLREYPVIGARMGYLCDRTDIYKAVFSLTSDIYSRAPGDPDFLTVRIGTSDQVPCCFPIQGSGQARISENAYYKLEQTASELKMQIFLLTDKGFDPEEAKASELSALPSVIAKNYRYMHNAPLLYSVQKCGTLGIVSREGIAADLLIQLILFDLCFYHKPEDLQCIMLFPPPGPTENSETARRNYIEDNVRNYKFLPHFRDLFKDQSQFVFDADAAASVFSQLLMIMTARQDSDMAVQLPHIVVVVYEEYGLKEHALAQFLPRVPEDGSPYVNKLGLTFIFCKQFREHLPAYCSDVVMFEEKRDARNGTPLGEELYTHQAKNVKEDEQHTEYTYCASLIPHDNKANAKRFALRWNSGLVKSVENLYNAYKVLAALSYSKISANARVPSSVGMFELFGVTADSIDIGAFYGKRGEVRKLNPAKTMAVPLGRTESGITKLDLHEKGDGPHMLVAGTTGSGKSETILTFLLGLCLYYRPDEVTIMLVDMKGGGFIKRVGGLPHVVGKVTDVDGDETGTGEAYMLRRFLNALRSEIRRRKLMLNAMHVDNVNSYIEVTRTEETLEKHIQRIQSVPGEKQLTEADLKIMRQKQKDEPMTQLVLIVDEFAELKRFSNESNDIDFMAEISTIARVGRSLGIHIVLISQNIEGAITEEISINSRSRLCLKVATRAASKQMIGNDLAAAPDMPGNGRAYLLVGTGSKFEYFQSGYSGAPAHASMTMPIEIVESKKSGRNTLFYRSDKDNEEIIREREELEKNQQNMTQLDVLVQRIIDYWKQHGSEFPPTHIVFQRPLPTQICLSGDTVYELKDGEYVEYKEVDA